MNGLVLVTWIDSSITPTLEHYDHDDFSSLTVKTNRSVGVLLAKFGDRIILARDEIDNGDQYRALVIIPKEAIREMYELRVEGRMSKRTGA